MNKLNSHVLVLDKAFLAVQVWTAKDAISAIVSGRARVVDLNYSWYEFKDWIRESKRIKDDELHLYSGIVRSPSIEIVIPQVIQVLSEKKIPQRDKIKFSRKNILQRDEFTCQYCGKKQAKKDLTLDHVIPKSRGGKSQWYNIVACCQKCNEEKGDRLPSELEWKLLKQPAKPRWKSHIGTSFEKSKKEYWTRFLG
jgi:5-methylcytosine-specific restriction endonuclease McrA